MALPLSHPTQAPSHGADLVGLIIHPAETFPRLLERERSVEIMGFAAISGIYVAFSAAQRLHLGDRFGFTLTAVGVVLLGLALGLLAFVAAGGLLRLSAEALRGHPEGERLFAVFGYATWPFTPLLIVLVPVLLALYGTELFSSARPPAPPVVPWIVNVLELTAIVLWFYMMVTGIAAAAELSRGTAAKTLALTFVEAIVLGVLLVVIAFVSFLI